MGAAPASLDWPVDMNPADYVAAVLVQSSFIGFGNDGNSTIPHAYHIYHPNPIALNDLFRWLIQTYKYNTLEMVSYNDWRSRLEVACSNTNENALFPLLPIFPRDDGGVPTSADYPTFDCSQTFGILHTCNIPLDWYVIDDASLTHMFDSLRNVDDEFPIPSEEEECMMFEFD